MQILGRILKLRRRRPDGPFGIAGDPGREPGTITWPELIRTIQSIYGLSTVDLGKLMGKSTSTIRTYKSYKVKREPPDSFKQAFYSLVKVLNEAPAEVLLTLDGRQGIIKGKDKTWHVVSLGSGIFLHECRRCDEFFVAQWNAKTCPTCKSKEEVRTYE